MNQKHIDDSNQTTLSRHRTSHPDWQWRGAHLSLPWGTHSTPSWLWSPGRHTSSSHRRLHSSTGLFLLITNSAASAMLLRYDWTDSRSRYHSLDSELSTNNAASTLPLWYKKPNHETTSSPGNVSPGGYSTSVGRYLWPTLHNGYNSSTTCWATL